MSSENIQKQESGPDSTVSNNKISSVTLNILAMNARKRAYYNFERQSIQKVILIQNMSNSTNLFRIHDSKPLRLSDISNFFR